MWGAAYVEVSPLAELATGSGEGSERRHSLSHLTVPIPLTFKRDPVRSSPHKPPHTVQGGRYLPGQVSSMVMFPNHVHLRDYHHNLEVKPHTYSLGPRLLPNSSTITNFSSPWLCGPPFSQPRTCELSQDSSTPETNNRISSTGLLLLGSGAQTGKKKSWHDSRVCFQRKKNNILEFINFSAHCIYYCAISQLVEGIFQYLMSSVAALMCAFEHKSWFIPLKRNRLNTPKQSNLS